MPTSLPIHGPHGMHAQTDSYNHYPTSIRVSRDFSSTVSQDLIDPDSTSTLTLAEDSNLADIAPWATPNNGSEPVSLNQCSVDENSSAYRLLVGDASYEALCPLFWEAHLGYIGF